MDVGTLTGSIAIDDQLSGALTVLTSKVQKFAENFDGAIGGLAIGAGVAVGAIAAVTTAIISLGNRGADVNDVAATLDKFAGSAQNAEAIMANLRKGTLDTVDDFDLMKESSKLLAAGVKLTAGDFGTLSSAAFVLQNQGLGPTKDMLALVSQALLTGRTRTLEMRLGKMDLSMAETNYAKTLGISKDELNETQKIEAKRIAILGFLNSKVKEAGAQQRDFGEQMEFVVTKIKNWGDELAKRVAASPAVMNAVNAIGDAIQKAFGGSSQTVMDTIVKLVDKFANAVATYGPIIISWIRDLVDYVKSLYTNVKAAWDAVPEWFKDMAKEAALAGGAVLLLNKATTAATGADVLTNLGSLATIWSAIGRHIADAVKYLKEFSLVSGGVWAGMRVLGTGLIDKLVGGMGAAGVAGFVAVGVAAGLAWSEGWFKGILGRGGMKGLQSDIETVLSGGLNPRITTDIQFGGVVGEQPAGVKPSITQASEAVQKLRDAMSGADLAKQVRDLSSALAGLNKPMGAAQLFDFSKQLDELRDKGAKLTPQLTVLADKYRQVTDAQAAWSDVLAEQARNTALSDAELDKLFANLAIEKAAKDAALTINNQRTMNAYNFQSSQIERWAKDEKQKVDRSVAGWEKAYDAIDVTVTETYQDMAAEASTLSMANAVAAAAAAEPWYEFGYRTTADLQLVIDKEKDLYNVMKAAGLPVGELKKQFDEVRLAEQALFDAVNPEWKKHTTAILEVGSAMTDLGQSVGGSFGAMIGGIGLALTAWGKMRDDISKTKDAAYRAIAIIGGITSVLGATAGANMGQNVIGGALAGAGAGLAIAGTFQTAGIAMSGATMGISLAVGALAGAIVGWVRSMKQAEQAQRALDTQLNTMLATVDKTYGSFEQASALAARFGLSLATATGSAGNRSKEDLQRVQDQLNELAETLQAVAADAEKFGLTWADMDLVDATAAAVAGADALLARMNRLVQAGYDVSAVQAGMAGEVNAWLASALRAGTGIPASMKPIIEALIRTGKLTEENARLLLGMSAVAVPSLQEVTDAAARYGLKLEDLGRGVQQISLTEQANQIVTDFNTLTAAGVPFETLMRNTTTIIENLDGTTTTVTTGMQQSIQDMVNASLGPLGIELPESMRPIIEKMIEAGLLTNGPEGLGNALTSTGQLQWAKPLSESIDELVLALGKLVDALTGQDSVTSNTIDMANITVREWRRMKLEADNYWASAFPGAVPFPGVAPGEWGTVPGPPMPAGSAGGAGAGREIVMPVQIMTMDNDVVAKAVFRQLVNVGGMG